SFGVRVGDEVYQQSVSDAGGLVPAGKVQTAFFVIAGTASGSRNDLAVANRFAVVLRQVTGEMDPHRKVTAEWHEPPNSIPTAQSGWREPALPGANVPPSNDLPKKSSARLQAHKKKTTAEKSPDEVAKTPPQQTSNE